jgi:citrate synthase
VGKTTHLSWLQDNRQQLEEFADCPLAFSGVAAAALFDLGFSPEQAEMLYLLLRLPGAAVHSLEQEKLGWRKYPFFADGFKLNP